MYLEKSSKLYVKITLTEGNRDLASKKIWCSSNKKIFDFSKELLFKLQGKLPENCAVKIQLKKYSGFRLKSKQSNESNQSKLIGSFFLDVRISEILLGPSEEGASLSHWTMMTLKPEDRIFMWHSLK